MNRYLFAYTYDSGFYNELVVSDLDMRDVVVKFKANHKECVVLNVIKLDVETKIPLTKEILDKNFKVDEEYKTYLRKTLIPYILEMPTLNSRKSWNLLWNTESNILYIEDDPIVKIKTVEELNYILKLANANKEIVV